MLAATAPDAELVLPPSLRLTPEQFALVCEANPDAVLELDTNGRVHTMTPTGGETGARNQALGALLWQAVQAASLPCKLFDSSTGFHLPDGSVLSPDAALVRLDRWQALTPEQRRSFPPLCPDLLVELASPSDEGPRGATALRRKMAAYQANGAQLGWLLFPSEQTVEVWHAGHAEPQRLVGVNTLNAAPAFPVLALDLEPIWAA